MKSSFVKLFSFLEIRQRSLGLARCLLVSNMFSAGLSFVVGVYIARLLVPENLAVVGVIAAINSSIIAFVDVRLNDVAAKVFYRIGELPPDRVFKYQSGVLWCAVLGTSLISGAMALLSALVGNSFVHFFTQTPISGWWLPLNAISAAINTIGATMVFLLRFSQEFYTICKWRFVQSLAGTAIMIVVLTAIPNLDGYYLAGLMGALVGLVLNVIVSWHVWSHGRNLPLRQPDIVLAGAAFRQSFNMIFYGNLLSYSKLFQRSADVLLVAWFADDRETGLYKLARSLIDGSLAIPQDALYQVYYPRFLDAFARRAKIEYRHLAGHLFKISGLITLALIAGEALLLPMLVPVIFGPNYRGVEWPMMVLTATFVFIVGFYPWLWAIFVGAGTLRGYTLAVFIATGVQYLVALTLFSIVGPSALMAMIGYMAYYLWLIPVIYRLAWRKWAEFLPGGPKPSPAVAA